MPLPPGLTLRTARPEDLDQIGTLLADRGEETDAGDHRLVVDDPDLGRDACAVVVDGDRVVSTATLLDETVRVGTVMLPAGQVDLVATDTAYEGRGLVRALMAWAHERSAARGHVLQAMLGIPYFYRRFGYQYAMELPRARRVDPTGLGPGAELRPAEARDVPALAALQAEAQARYDVAMAHPPARWRWLLAQEASTTLVLERSGAVVASARTTTPGETLLAAEPAAVDRAAADALLAALAARAEAAGARPVVVHRPGTVTGDAWEPRLAPIGPGIEQYYVRIPDAAVLLDRLRPVLAARLAASGLDRSGRDLLISTFGAHHRMAIGDGLGEVRTGGAMQDPGAHGGAGVAPDRLADLLFGRGMRALAAWHPDVYPGPDRELSEALFPPVTADLLTYYLDW